MSDTAYATLFQDLVEQAEIAILIDNDVAGFNYFNQKFLDLFGFPSDEMRQQSIKTLVHPEDRERVLKFHHGRLKGLDMPAQYEFRGVRKDGGVIDLEVVAVPIEDENNIKGTRSYLWEVSSDRQREVSRQRDLFLDPESADLKTSLDRLDVVLQREMSIRQETQKRLEIRNAFQTALLNATTEMALLLNKDLSVLLANTPTCQYLAMTSSEILGCNLSRLNRAWGDVANHIRETEQPEACIVREAGRTCQFTGYPVMGADARLDGIALYVKDVSEDLTKKQELQLKNAAMMATPTVMLLFDLTGSLNYFNPAAGAFFAKLGCELVHGMSLESLLISSEKSSQKWPGLRSFYAWSGEWTFVTAAGKEKQTVVNVSKIVDDGTNAGYVCSIEDLTELKALYSELEARQRLYQNLVENLHEVFFVLDSQECIEYISPQIGQYSSKPPEWFAGQMFLGFIHEEDVPDFSAVLSKVKTGCESCSVEFRWLGSDGRLFWMYSSFSLSDMETGSEVIQGLMYDITARRMAEAELDQSRQRLQTMIDACKDSFILLDRGPRVLLCNNTFANSMGMQRDDLIGVSLMGPESDLFPKELNRCRLEYLKTVAESKETVRFQDQRDGRWLDNQIYPIVDGDGEINQFVVYSRDVTELRLMSQALQHTVNKYRKLVESSPDIIITVNQVGEIEFANATCRKLGLQSSEMIGRPLHAVLKLLDHNVESMESMFGNGDISNRLVTVINDPEAPWEGMLSIYNTENSALDDRILILRDISDYRAVQKMHLSLEKQLAEAERLAVVGQVTAEVAHELNNSLDVIQTKLFLIQQKYGPDVDGEVSSQFGGISMQLSRIGQFAENMLKLVRPLNPEPRPVNLNKLLIDVVNELRSAGEPVCPVEVEEPGQSLFVTGDGVNLQVVFKNVIMNALQASKSDGRIEVTLLALDSGMASCTVTDWGTGIAVENLDRVFKPLFTTRHDAGGNGLGLAMCRRIVQEHNGKISIESKLGVGTTVTIELPRCSEDGAAA